MKISGLQTSSNIFLAPMAGVTDAPFRRLCSRFGAGLCFTEMVSVKALLHNSKKTVQMLSKYAGEYPVAVQLFGHEPMDFYKVISSGILDEFDMIDINMGCPAPKIVKNGDGSSLMKDIDLAERIITACVKATDKPVSVKFRKGFAQSDDIAVRFAKMCERAGAKMITYHPRTREQGFSGKVDVEDIKRVKEAVSILVVGNGDVCDKESFEKMSQCCDAVMIGRYAVGHPEIFSILQGKDVNMTKQEIARLHLQYLKEYTTDERYIVNTFKRHAFNYVTGVENKKKIAMATSIAQLEEVLFAN